VEYSVVFAFVTAVL